jgi:glucose-6-phosphate 1-dehydrogenase
MSASQFAHRLPPFEEPVLQPPELREAPPLALVIFAVTGDLANRKLLPALYNLAHERALPEGLRIIGVARRQQCSEAFRQGAAESIQRYSRRLPDQAVLERLLASMQYVEGLFGDDALFDRLGQTLRELEHRTGRPHARVFYLSTAPTFFSLIAGKLRAAGLHRSTGPACRLVIEKPFGHDLASARALNVKLLSAFDESRVFRVDHYLGKETVQNLMALRFANSLFEPVWNRNYVDHVQITAAERIGVETRAGYYDGAGALRDLVQNHMLQLLALVTMEPPTSLQADRIRNEKVKVLQAVVPPELDSIASASIRAQYRPGSIGGARVCGYWDEPGVAPGSRTETYAALRLEISNWRWAGVPFYLRTGKRLPRKLTEIAVTLKPIPHMPFRDAGETRIQPNQITLTIQPDEGVSVSLAIKVPGERMRIQPVDMQFRYRTSFNSQFPDAYEPVLLDALRGDTTLFTRDDEIEALWSIIDPVLAAWQQDTTSRIPCYAAGLVGPPEADTLLDGGRRWRPL